MENKEHFMEIKNISWKIKSLTCSKEQLTAEVVKNTGRSHWLKTKRMLLVQPYIAICLPFACVLYLGSGLKKKF